MLIYCTCVLLRRDSEDGEKKSKSHKHDKKDKDAPKEVGTGKHWPRSCCHNIAADCGLAHSTRMWST